ncbi:MAG: hypothetical protein JNL92_03770 [Opitutaceae bacterium]|nr:hypothetical protein [Opitutaceae bacterium]
MAYLWRTTGLLVIVAALVAVASYRLGRDTEINEALAKRDALAWLRTDFRLDDAQFAAIQKLHLAYSTVCERHCEAIQEAALQRNALRATPGTDAEALAAADRRLEELRRVCESAIAAHVREVAAQMAPEQGRRYLALVLPRIADFDHRAAPDVGLNAHRH